MRSDSNLRERFSAEGVDTREYGSMPGVLDTNTRVEGRGRVLRSHSFSGHETNSVFINEAGASFSDVSALSGMDSLSDGRGFAYLDFDRDGWTDIALVNSNAPQLELFRNRLGDLGAAGQAVHFRLIGSTASAQPTAGQSSKSAAGAHVLARAGGLLIRRECRLGDGFAIQNSPTLSVGIGSQAAAEEVRIEWPSGRSTEVGRVPAGSRLTVRESPAPGESAVVVDPAGERGRLGPRGPALALERWPGVLPASNARLRIITTMATWCAVCRGELPHLSDLRAALPGTEVALLGFPIDPEDTEEGLDAYRQTHQPAYSLMAGVTQEEKAAVKQLLIKHLGDAVLPATVFVDAQGAIVRVRKGTPTLSEIRGWARQMPP